MNGRTAGSSASASARSSSSSSASPAPPSQEKSEDKGPSNLKRGLLITLISSLLYTSYAAAGKFFSVSSWDMLFPQAVFMVLGTTIISFCMSGKDAMDSLHHGGRIPVTLNEQPALYR